MAFHNYTTKDHYTPHPSQPLEMGIKMDMMELVSLKQLWVWKYFNFHNFLWVEPYLEFFVILLGGFVCKIFWQIITWVKMKNGNICIYIERDKENHLSNVEKNKWRLFKESDK